MRIPLVDLQVQYQTIKHEVMAFLKMCLHCYYGADSRVGAIPIFVDIIPVLLTGDSSTMC